MTEFLKTHRWKLILAAVLIAVLVATRLLPHLWNMTPLVAIALFAGVYLGKNWALAIAGIGMVIGDIVIGFYNPGVMISVYAMIVLAVAVSGLISTQRYRFLTAAGSAAITAILFFLITNAAVWKFSGMYAPDVSGLVQSYLMGLPFFKNMLIGDVVYTVGLFAAYELFMVSRQALAQRLSLESRALLVTNN